MATYNASAVSDLVLAFKKGITLQQMRALRDNLTAIAEGAAGAPRVNIGALERLNPGAIVRSRFDATQSTNITSFTQAILFPFLQAGTVTITLQHREPVVDVGNASEARVVRYRNFVTTVIATWSTASTSFVSRAVDVGVLPGDSLIVQHRTTDAVRSSEMRFVRLQTNGENFLPGIEFPVEGNVFL